MADTFGLLALAERMRSKAAGLPPGLDAVIRGWAIQVERAHEQLVEHAGLPVPPGEPGDGLTFSPPADWINRLPDPYRRWIHDLEMRLDPAGDLAARRAAEENAAALLKQVEELEALVRQFPEVRK